MKKRISFLLLLAFVAVFVAACGTQQAQPTATVAPAVQPTATAMPTLEPTEEPTAPAPTAEPESAGDLTSYPWLWTSFTSPVKQFEVETPENYVVTFNDDGTVNIKADCNNASGSYAVDGGGLTIEVGPMTMAACPPDSRSDQY